MKNTFKFGDKVRIKKLGTYWDHRENFEVGATGTVSGMSATSTVVTNSAGRTCAFFESDSPGGIHDFLELVTEETPKPASELEQLVADANKGLLALNKLYARQDEVETWDTRGGEAWNPGETDVMNVIGNAAIGYLNGDFALRIKPPKPAFEPFSTSVGHKVRLDGKTLHVGCQSFAADDLKCQLSRLCQGGVSATVRLSSGEVREAKATRKGVSTEAGAVSWEDADKILKALEAAGV